MNSLSVIITCFREGKLLLDAVASIENQSLLPQEIIIVNDATTHQETINVCKELEKNPLITIIWRETNGGTSVARNNGAIIATGDILIPLDADDILPPNALELISKTFQQHPEIGFVYGNYLRCDQSSQDTKVVNPGEISLEIMLQAKRLSFNSNWKLLGATPIRRSLWLSLNGYDTNFGIEDLHDVEFWIRVLALESKYQYIPETIYIWRKYLGSNSSKVTPLSWYRIAKKHFPIYQKVGLTPRAYQLLLIGSKWSNSQAEIKLYSNSLQQIKPLTPSTLFLLLIPPSLLRFLTNIAIKKR